MDNKNELLSLKNRLRETSNDDSVNCATGEIILNQKVIMKSLLKVLENQQALSDDIYQLRSSIPSLGMPI